MSFLHRPTLIALGVSIFLALILSGHTSRREIRSAAPSIVPARR